MGLGCLGCLTLPVILAALVGGGVFFWMQGPVDVVKAELADMRAGKLDAAYGRLSDGYRRELSPADLQALVSAHPVLKDNADYTLNNRSIVNDRVRLAGSLRASTGEAESVVIEMVKERGQWRISRIRLGHDADADEDLRRGRES